MWLQGHGCSDLRIEKIEEEEQLGGVVGDYEGADGDAMGLWIAVVMNWRGIV